MATAKKLPSGNWRVRVFSHKDGTGKLHYESFTAPTKREAELMAAEFGAKKERRAKHNMRVGEVIDGYITAKTGVLSPSTIREYRQMQRTRYDSIKNIPIKKLSNEDLQLFVSDLAGKISPKTVSNVYGLLTSSVAMYAPELHFRVTLPKKAKRRPDAPTDEDVAALFADANNKMKRAIALAAFGSLRRGEICAVTYGDLSGNVLRIDKDMVLDEHKKWVTKDIPKTADSLRDVILPDKVVALLGSGEPSERIVPYSPSSITSNFTNLRKRVGLTIRFHDLRHYFASIGAVLGVPDVYLASFGGWRQGSNVMKEIYQNKITPISDQYARKMGDHFDELIKNYDTKYDTANKKAAI